MISVASYSGFGAVKAIMSFLIVLITEQNFKATVKGVTIASIFLNTHN